MVATISPAEVLKKSKVVAVVGASKDPEKDAHTVPLYLKEHGYRIVPINPTTAEVLGEKAYPSLLDLPENVGKTVDVVEVFRPSQELPRVAAQAVELKKRLSGRQFVFWAQLGLENDEAKRLLESNGIPYVMNACMRSMHRANFRAT